MKPQFQNLDIECWQHKGRLGFNEPSICLQASAEACDVLLAAIDELIADGIPAKRLLTLKQSQRHKRCASIRLILSPESDDLRQMSLTRNGETAVFEFTSAGVQAFRDAVVGGMAARISPFTLGEGEKKSDKYGARDLESGEVWFWTPNMDP